MSPGCWPGSMFSVVSSPRVILSTSQSQLLVHVVTPVEEAPVDGGQEALAVGDRPGAVPGVELPAKGGAFVPPGPLDRWGCGVVLVHSLGGSPAGLSVSVSVSGSGPSVPLVVSVTVLLVQVGVVSQVGQLALQLGDLSVDVVPQGPSAVHYVLQCVRDPPVGDDLACRYESVSVISGLPYYLVYLMLCSGTSPGST